MRRNQLLKNWRAYANDFPDILARANREEIRHHRLWELSQQAEQKVKALEFEAAAAFIAKHDIKLGMTVWVETWTFGQDGSPYAFYNKVQDNPMDIFRHEIPCELIGIVAMHYAPTKMDDGMWPKRMKAEAHFSFWARVHPLYSQNLEETHDAELDQVRIPTEEDMHLINELFF